MTPISAIIIAKNEEEMIADCLDSVSFCQERIVIDNNSTDRTVDLAKKLGATVFSSDSLDFSSLRNFGLEKAKQEWILYIDADERVSNDLAKEITAAITKKDAADAYALPRKNFYYDNIAWPDVEVMKRLFKKSSLSGWHGKLHETPKTQGTTATLQQAIYHYTHRNLSQMVEKTNAWSDIEAKLRFDTGHPLMTWWRFLRVMFTGFFRSYVLQKGWKVGSAGFIEGVYQAFSMFITYAKLWELQEESNKKK